MTHANFTMGAGSKLYECFSYPAGEIQIRLTQDGLGMAQHATDITIQANVRNSDDLMRLCLLTDAVKAVAMGQIEIILPYLPYARADRRFTVGDCAGLEVFGSILHSLNVERIKTLDVHSAAALTCVPGLVDVSPLPFISKAVARFAQRQESNGVTVLFPDEGAAKRYELPANFASWNFNDIQVQQLNCLKKREPVTGKLVGFTVPDWDSIKYPNAILIVDDICDGGGTFLGIARELTDRGIVSLGLYVTHGIFSKGFADLRKEFVRIYSTDSMGIERSDEDVHTFECGAVLRSA